MEKHLVICIGRQFGSGGREIGLGLAKSWASGSTTKRS